jgi:hypothetical protein
MNILRFQVGVIGQNLVPSFALGCQTDNRGYSNPKMPDTRHPSHLGMVDGNAIELGHCLSPE